MASLDSLKFYIFQNYADQFGVILFYLNPVLVTLQDSTMTTIPCHPLKSCLNTNHLFLSVYFYW